MWLYHITAAMKPVWSLYWRLRITGAVDAVPLKGPLIVVVNHSSFLDPWFVGVLFPRPLHYLITDKWYNKSKSWRAVFDAYGTLPVRGGDPRGTIGDVCGYLASGKAVGIFPEGRISADARVRRFRRGFARAAARSGAPVVPLGIRGGHESIPRHRRIPKPSAVTVHVGRPLVFPGAPHAEEPPREQVAEFVQLAFEEVCRLSGQPAPPESGPGVAESKEARGSARSP